MTCSIHVLSIYIFLRYLSEINWTSISEDIVLLLYEGNMDYAQHHGVCKLDDKVLIKYMPDMTVFYC